MTFRRMGSHAALERGLGERRATITRDHSPADARPADENGPLTRSHQRPWGAVALWRCGLGHLKHSGQREKPRDVPVALSNQRTLPAFQAFSSVS